MEGGGGAPEDERSTQAIKKAHPLSDNETLISIILSLTDHHLMIKGAPEDERSMHVKRIRFPHSSAITGSCPAAAAPSESSYCGGGGKGALRRHHRQLPRSA